MTIPIEDVHMLTLQTMKKPELLQHGKSCCHYNINYIGIVFKAVSFIQLITPIGQNKTYSMQRPLPSIFIQKSMASTR